jgi:hypothetical protein
MSTSTRSPRVTHPRRVPPETKGWGAGEPRLHSVRGGPASSSSVPRLRDSRRPERTVLLAATAVSRHRPSADSGFTVPSWPPASSTTTPGHLAVLHFLHESPRISPTGFRSPESRLSRIPSHRVSALRPSDPPTLRPRLPTHRVSRPRLPTHRVSRLRLPPREGTTTPTIHRASGPPNGRFSAASDRRG